MKCKYCILSIIISAALLAGCLSACGESSTIGIEFVKILFVDFLN